MKNLVVRFGLISAGALFAYVFILMQQRFPFSLLHNLPGVVGLGMIFAGIFWPWLKRVRKFLMTVFIIYFGTFALMCVFIFANAVSVPDDGHDAVIVFGAGLVRGDQITLVLRQRLDTALGYLNSNENAVVVVTGGLGNQATVTEAYAMSLYLIERGVSPERIIQEGMSTSTIENLKYARILLDEHFDGGDYTVVIVTNDFHLPRGRLLARRAGFVEEGLAAPTQRWMMPRYYSREHLAVSWTVFTWFMPPSVFYLLQ